MPNLKGRIDDFLLTGRVMIENSISDKDILAKIAEYGFDEKKLKAAQSLHAEVVDLHNKQKKEYGEQYQASGALEAAFEKANGEYMKSVKVARVALQDSAKAAALLLYGERKQSLAGWVEQATAFYTNLLNDTELLSRMEAFGYTRARLESEFSLVKDVTIKMENQKKEIGEAQEATEKRNRKIDELDRWLGDFKKIAKIAFTDDRQKLEKLGILART